MVARDPQGILERVPELAELAHLPSVRRAIERGNLHGLYRALFFARLTGKAKDKRELFAMLLSRRRLFLTPLKGAPVLRTVNGVGATVYGRADVDINDQTYIKTLFLVFVFVPVFPLAQYLVRDANPRGWTFIGKVPLGALPWLWRTGFSAAIVTGLLVALGSAFHASRYNEVYVANGLPIGVAVELERQHAQVAPGGYVKLDTRAGDQAIVITAKDGHVIERGTVHVEPGIDVQGWNVLGAAPVMRNEMVYVAADSSRSGADEGDATLACGTNAFGYDGVDFAFTDPPKTVSMSKGQNRATRIHVALIDGGAKLCMRWLDHKEQRPRAAKLARDLAALADYDFDATRAAAYRTLQADGGAAAIEFARAALAKHEASVDLHRLYQEIRARNGEREQVLAEYRARLAQKPDDVTAGYLLARLEYGAEARAAFDALLVRAPHDANVLRAHAWAHMRDADYAGALVSWQALQSADAAQYAEMSPAIAETLVALGRVEDALQLLERPVPREEPPDAFERAVMYGQVAHLREGADPDKLVLALPDFASAPATRAWFHVRCGQAPEASELATLADDQRAAADMMLSTRAAPADALARAPTAGNDALHLLSPDSWMLLYAEALRLGGDGEAAARALSDASPAGSTLPRAIAEFMHTGTMNADIDELPSSLRAALHFVRSRDTSLSREERARCLKEARAEDVLHSIVTQAAAAWPG